MITACAIYTHICVCLCMYMKIFLRSRCSDLLICDISPAVKSFLLLRYLRRKTSKLIFVSVRRTSAATSCSSRRGRPVDSWRADEGSFKMFFSLEKYFRCYTSSLPPAECVCVCVCDRPVCLELAVDDRLALRHCRCL